MMAPEILKEIEKFGALAFNPEQLAIILEMDKQQIIQALDDKNSDIHKAYFKGVLTREAELRSVVFDQALSGSTPAQAVAIGYFEKLRLDLMG
jgi:hypothetical protein